jgi:hypothetical protein
MINKMRRARASGKVTGQGDEQSMFALVVDAARAQDKEPAGKRLSIEPVSLSHKVSCHLIMCCEYCVDWSACTSEETKHVRHVDLRTRGKTEHLFVSRHPYGSQQTHRSARDGARRSRCCGTPPAAGNWLHCPELPSHL